MGEVEEGAFEPGTSVQQDAQAESHREDLVARNVNLLHEEQFSFSDRLADAVARFGGSWRFILFFGAFVFLWGALNSWLLVNQPFDPYPYIFLNLLLSSLAAIQAPIIMMSQNRIEAKDRLRAENDYLVNLKAETEINELRAKIDTLAREQWQDLVRLQERQIEMLERLVERLSERLPEG